MCKNNYNYNLLSYFPNEICIANQSEKRKVMYSALELDYL